MNGQTVIISDQKLREYCLMEGRQKALEARNAKLEEMRKILKDHVNEKTHWSEVLQALAALEEPDHA